MRGREDLHPYAIEKPWRVGRNVRRLVGPVIEVVIAEESDVRHKDSGIDVDSVQRVEVVSAIRFRNIAIGVGQVPLPACGAGIVTRCRH